MDWLTDPQIWASLLTLIGLEIVLGIDNLVFIAILAGRLPAERRHRAAPRRSARPAGRRHPLTATRRRPSASPTTCRRTTTSRAGWKSSQKK